MEGYIVGGNDTHIRQYSHAAFLARKKCDSIKWVCGASVLNQKILITAGHCTMQSANITKPEHSLMVYMGHEDLNEVTILRLVVNIIRHHGYNEMTLKHDISLLVVDTNIPLGDDVKRVIITPTFPKDGYEGFVAGWGSTGVREVIARVFHFLQDEYNFMKMNNYDHCDLSPLANIRKRTAEATGVGERSVTTILKEEKEIMVSKPLAIQYKFPDPRTAKRLKINKELVKENEDQKEDEDRIKCEKEDNFKVEEEVFGL